MLASLTFDFTVRLLAADPVSVAFRDQQYRVSRWTAEKGLPQTRVACLAQTPDGYLWCGTWFGLARFDGVRFVPFNRLNTKGLAASDAIQQLAVDADGMLWVGTAKALLRQTEHGFVEVLLAGGWGGYGVSGLWPQSNGGVWATGEKGLVRTDGTNTIVVSLPEAKGVPRVIASAKGRPFVVDQNDVVITAWQLSPAGSWQQLALPGGRAGTSGLIGPAPSGVWVYWADRLLLCSQEGIAQDQQLPKALVTTGIRIAAPAREGGFWLLDTAGRLWRWHSGTAEELQIDQAPHFSQGVAALFEDREANLWVSCDQGLFQLHRRVIRSFTMRNGLPADETWSVCRARAGGIWVGGKGGKVCRVVDEKVENLPPLRQSGIEAVSIQCVLEDSQQRLLASASHSLGTFEFASGLWKPWPETASYSDVLYEDRTGRLWVAGNGGAACRDGTRWRFWPRTNNLPDASVRVIHQAKDGTMWFGTQRHGLVRLEEKTGNVRMFGFAEGLASDEVWAIHETDGTLWIGGNRGLATLPLAPAAKAFSFTTEHGLPDDAVNWILEDGQAYLWLSGLRGVHRLARSELEAVARGKLTTASCANYGLADGMENAESNGEHAPAGCVDAQGRLWFPTGEGVVRIDPKLVNLSEPPPMVALEEVRVDEEVVFDNASHLAGSDLQKEPDPNHSLSAGRLRLAPGRARRVKFRYTTPTFVNAERARFRHRLRGLNDTWREAGEERVAYFNDLKHGDYLFEVAAANAHGIWAETPAAFAFSLAPRFSETWPFYGLCALGAVAAVSGVQAYRLRVQRRILELQHQRSLERERVRIARDLHDDLGTALTGLALELDVIGGEVKEAPAIAEHLTGTAQRTRGLAERMREVVWSVNPRCDTVSSLADFLETQVSQFLRADGIHLRTEFPEDIPPLPLGAEARHQLALCVREALTNVVRHTHATEVVLGLALESHTAPSHQIANRMEPIPDRLVIKVKDNGCGFESTESNGRKGHGLTNMSERLEQIGGAFECSSVPGSGTVVTFRLPLASVLPEKESN